MLTAETLTIPFGHLKGQLAHTQLETNRKYLVYLVEKTNLADFKKDLLIKLLSGTEHPVPAYEPQLVSSERAICELVEAASFTAKIEFVPDESRIFLKDTWRGHYVYLVPEPGFYDQFLALLREGRRKNVIKFTHAEVLRVTQALTRKRKLRALTA
jgi:hypothetical protein